MRAGIEVTGRNGAGDGRRPDWLARDDEAQSQYGPVHGSDTVAVVPWLMLPTITGWIEQ